MREEHRSERRRGIPRGARVRGAKASGASENFFGRASARMHRVMEYETSRISV